MKGSECWVTSAESDAEGWAATVLARSIRKTLTSRPITIAVSENVSQPMRSFLQREFDSVFRFETNEVGGKGHGKIFIWNLRSWTKCIYIDPYSYMLKNTDELFAQPAFSAPIKTQNGNSTFDTYLFVFKPNLCDFDHMMHLGDTSKGNSNGIVNKQFKSLIGKTRHEIPSSFHFHLTESDQNSSSPVDFNIITFNDHTWKNGYIVSDKVTEGILNKWVSTFVHEVIPDVTKLNNVSHKEYLLSSLEKLQLPTTNGPKKPNARQLDDLSDLHDSIAVVGMSCRFPGANNTDEFWNVLSSGRDLIRPFPSDRPIQFTGSTDAEGNYQAGFLKCPVDEFDAKFFGISPREAPFVDPQQRLLLEVIWESLENANINPQKLRESNTGVFVGIWQQEYDKFIPNIGLTANEYHHRYLGNAFSATASRISHFLGLYGPNYAIESGCSSSSSGVHLAVQSLRRGETSLAIASGVNLVLHAINPFGGGNSDAVVFSTDFRCKTFDGRADGFVRSEGCGAVVMKLLPEAIHAGDHVLGIIRGTALNNDGPGTSFGTPNAQAQQRVFKEALIDAKIEPNEVSLVEAHGTGTLVGDPIEMYAIGQVYSEDRKDLLIVSSVKSNIGHTEACAGIAGLIKILLCLKHKKIPPHLHLQKLNPRIDLENIPAIIPTELTDWNMETRIAAVSSFSMSGTNVHLIVQETPKSCSREERTGNEKSKPLQMIGISAKSEEALEALYQKYLLYLEENPQISLEDIALTLNTGRANMPHRLVVVAKDTQHLISQYQNKKYIIGRAPTQKQKIVFLFTGQGSQYFGMAKNLYEVSQIFRAAFDRCNALFRKSLSYSLKTVLWKDATLLEKTLFCQPAIFSVQYCLFQLWKSFGIFPDFVLGHSVGEFCASVCAGVLSLEDGMKLVIGRSKLVDLLEYGKMLAVKTSPLDTRRLIKEFTAANSKSWVDVAAENSSEEVVVSGIGETIQEFANFCAASGVKTQAINATHAFHSRHMDSVADGFKLLASEVSPRKPNCVYVSGTLAREIKEGEFDSVYWVRHLRDTVRFQDAVKFVYEKASERRIFVEIGSQPILLALAMANVSDSSQGVFCPSLRKNEDEVSSVLNSIAKLYLAGVEISWNDWFVNGRKVSLPTYPFQRQKFWFHAEDEGIPSCPLLHPLLGRQLPVPVSDHIFAQVLSSKQLTYVADHRVAERIILPAAAYLETIMAAGCHVLQGGRVQVPFAVENLAVEAALELSKSCQIQTIVRSVGGDDGVKFEIGIHKQTSRKELDKWKQHAVATFSPSHLVVNATKIDIAATQSEMTPVDSMERAYEAVAKAGIQFGPKFQSIVQAWKLDNTLLAEVNTPPDSASYICHPIVLDAMIQAFAFRTALISADKSEIELQLPIAIKKFTWLSKESTSKVFVYITWANESEGNVLLLNDAGETLATMEGVELIATNVSNFLRILNTEANTLPGLMEEIWRPTSGITRNRHELGNFKIQSSKFVEDTLGWCTGIEENVVKGTNVVDRLFTLFLLRAVRELQWPWPNINENLMISDWADVVPPGLQIGTTGRFIEILELSNYLRETDHGVYEVIKEIPSLETLEADILASFQVQQALDSEKNIVHQFVKRCGLHFTSVLQGKLTPIQYLFPADPQEVGALQFYTEGRGARECSELATSLVLDYASFARESHGVLRILEVGAGSGVCCSLILEGLAKLNMPVQYTFTDISPLFLHEAKTKFPKGVTFAVFNIEEDPLAQGFAPEEFDFIIGTNVIHATADIAQSLRNLHVVLRPNGILVAGETFKELAYMSLSFGFLDGWWRYTDSRRGSPLMNPEQWQLAFEQAGFSETKTTQIFRGINGAVVGRKMTDLIPRKVDSATKPWLHISDGSQLQEKLKDKMARFGRHSVTLRSTEYIPIGLEGILFLWTVHTNPSDENQQKCEELLQLCQKLVSTYQDIKIKPKLVLVTRGVNYLGDSGQGNPNAATITSFIRSFSNEHPDFVISVIDLDQDESNFDREVDELFACLWSTQKEMFRAVRDNKVFVQRLVSADRQKMPLPLPNSNRFKISNPPSKSLNDLQITVASRVEPIADQVEVAVRACALNFRDIFVILQPDDFKIPDNVNKEPGMDISGIVTAIGPECSKFKVGDSVFGFATGGGLSSHVIVASQLLFRKPPETTFTSAATIPVAFITVLYSFLECAKLHAGDRVLIHVATGGVGLAAVQFAKNVGAEIFATAGSRRKRAYLRSIGIQHVYHSRNTTFSEEILKDTSGQGVNVVLNSLTGPNFKESSLKACSQNARFVEIGKINIWTEEEVKNLRPDVKYFIVELSITANEEPEKIKDFTKTIESEFDKGIYKGLPHDTFPLDLIREAFFYFQEAKHIGKIVISIPEAKVSPEGRITFNANLFQAESTYLITGGLGGIGMEVAKWMCTKGAENLVLTGRNGPNVKCQEVIDKMNEDGCRVVFVQADVGSYDQCELLLQTIQNLEFPPLRGIMHAAGILSDGIVINQSWDKFESVFQPKVRGTWNLHKLTLGYDLEFFTMFSSVISIMGMPGQSNHAAANRFLDSFAHYRWSFGLPANSINFGPWSDVGVAANIKIARDGVIGVRSFSPVQGILSIENILRLHSLQLAVCDVSDWTVVKQIIQLGHLLDEMKSSSSNTTNLSEEYKFIIEEIKKASPEERQEKIENFLEKAIKETLRIPENEQLDRDQNFSEIGVDSLMAMELRNRLQGMLGDKQLTVSALQENRTIRSLSAHMTSLMNSDISIVDVATLVAQDSILPAEIQATTQPPSKPSDFKQIFLTGATGHLGVNFLPALQNQNPNLIIHCIVRAKDSAEATERLHKTLRLYSLFKKVNLENIRILAGDISKPNFDMSLESYESLTESVDAIAHCAVKSNHLEEYNAFGDGSLRTMNVLATVNILRFAATGRTKAVLYASSLLAVTRATEDGTLVEQFPAEDDFGDSIKHGYMLSKFVCEKLMSQAVERGIPVTAIRYASIFGNSETGFIPTGKNHSWEILVSCIRVRKFPRSDQNGIPIISVDTAAEISVRIFLHDNAETGVYNLTSSSVASEDDIKTAFSKFGVDGEFVPYTEWRDLVFEETDLDKNPLKIYSEYYGANRDANDQTYLQIHPLAVRVEKLQINVLSSKVIRNAPQVKLEIVPAKILLERHLQYYYNQLTSEK